MKRSQVLTKLETFMGLLEQGLVAETELQASLQKQISEGTIKPLPESAFDKATAGLKEFASKFGLVKVKKASGGGGGGRTGAEVLVLAQYPAMKPYLEAVEFLKGKAFDVAHEDGSYSTVAFQPFWRTVKAEEEDEASEGQVSV